MKYEEIITDPTWLRDIKAGICEPEALASYLISTVPVAKLARLCSEYIYEESKNAAPQIVITEEAFKKHFRIQGWREVDGFTGTKENRGNYSDGRNKR